MEKSDLIIVGAGVSGMVAALQAYSMGIRKITMLEKMDHAGGNGVYSWIPIGKKNSEQADVSQPKRPSTSQLLKNAVEWSHGRINISLVRELIRTADSNSDALLEYLPSEKRTFVGYDPKIIATVCEQLGICILYSTVALNLVTEISGAIIGVEVKNERTNSTVTLYGEAVIIATGGFIGNSEMMQRFFPFCDKTAYDEMTIVGNKYSGDGVRMALDVGAGIDTTAIEWEVNRYPWNGRFGESALSQILDHGMYPYPIWLNANGERFVDETDMCSMNNYFRQPHQMCYTFFDEAMLNIMTSDTRNDVPVDYSTGGGAFRLKVMDEIKEACKAGRAIVSQDLHTISHWMHVDYQKLLSTLNEYNSGCVRGCDAYFYRNKNKLFKLEVPPFYCIKTVSALLLTRGPIKASTALEVVTTNNEVIKNLFIAGVDVGGMDSDTYAGNVPMHSSQWAVASGRIAGTSAAKLIYKKRN